MNYHMRINGGAVIPSEHLDEWVCKKEVIDTGKIPDNILPEYTELKKIEIVDEDGDVCAMRKLPYPIFIMPDTSYTFIWTFKAEGC